VRVSVLIKRQTILIKYDPDGRGICAMPFDLSNQTAKPIRCPDCDIDMQLFVSASTSRVFASTILERRLFVCMNCQRLGYQLVAMPLDSSSSQELNSAALDHPA